MRLLAASLTAVLLAVPVVAQAAPAGANAAGHGPDNTQLDRCNAAAAAAGLHGVALQQAVGACMLKSNPQLAARVRCLMKEQPKTMSQQARAAAIKTCLKNVK